MAGNLPEIEFATPAAPARPDASEEAARIAEEALAAVAALRSELDFLRSELDVLQQAAQGMRPPTETPPVPTPETEDEPIPDAEAFGRAPDPPTPHVMQRSVQWSPDETGQFGLWHLTETSSDDIFTIALSATPSYDQKTLELGINFNPGDPGTGYAYLMCGKRVNVATGAAELVWYEMEGGQTTVTIPNAGPGTDYENVINWYYSLQDMLEDGPPSGMSDPIPLPDPEDPGDWMWKDLDFWKLGGDETTCYGSVIGDSSKAATIDLDGKSLVGSSWSAGGDFDASGTVRADTLEARAGYVIVSGQYFAPQTVSIGGTNYTILVKQ